MLACERMGQAVGALRGLVLMKAVAEHTQSALSVSGWGEPTSQEKADAMTQSELAVGMAKLVVLRSPRLRS